MLKNLFAISSNVEENELDLFVITRSVDGGKTALDYLSKDSYGWVESGALAKWFRSEEEAQQFVEEHSHQFETVFIKPYDPIDTLVNPTETDRNAVIQDVLVGMLTGGE